jgi:DNA polymerase-3 subunit gamma/tau
MPPSRRATRSTSSTKCTCSPNAFNALLKTLEEPPPHVKFLFATTEIRKVPVTVLSRCQRFDLRRISAEKLAAHFGGLLETVHGVTLLKAGGRGSDPAQSVEEREAFAEWASQLGFAPLHRLWQLLLKGHDEVVRAAMPAEAADMALLRLIHAASLPDPSDLARLLEGGAQIASAAPPASSAAAPSPAPPAAAMPSSFEALVQALWDRNKGLIADEIEHFVRPIRYAPPELDFEPAKPMAQDQIDRIRLAIEEVTRGRWQMRAMSGDAQPTIIERREHAEQQARDALLGLPVMQAAMQAFPDAELLGADDTAKWSESA